NDRKKPRVVRRAVLPDEEGAAAFGARDKSALTFVGAEQIFDDFGAVFPALVANRSLRPREAILDEFSRLEGAGLAVMGSQGAVSTAGFEGQAGEVFSFPAFH